MPPNITVNKAIQLTKTSFFKYVNCITILRGLKNN